MQRVSLEGSVNGFPQKTGDKPSTNLGCYSHWARLLRLPRGIVPIGADVTQRPPNSSPQTVAATCKIVRNSLSASYTWVPPYPASALDAIIVSLVPSSMRSPYPPPRLIITLP